LTSIHLDLQAILNLILALFHLIPFDHHKGPEYYILYAKCKLK